jgi:hypothetical protein
VDRFVAGLYVIHYTCLIHISTISFTDDAIAITICRRPDMKDLGKKILITAGSTLLVSTVTAGIGALAFPKEAKSFTDNITCIIAVNNSCNKNARSQPKFFATTVGEQWVTAIHGRENEVKRVVVFSADPNYFAPAYPPERRAKEVAERMNRFADLGYEYKFMVKKINGYDVLCGMNPQGDCQVVILTIKKYDDAQARIPALQAHLAAGASATPLFESACDMAIDFQLFAGSKDDESKALTSNCRAKQ